MSLVGLRVLAAALLAAMPAVYWLPGDLPLSTNNHLYLSRHATIVIWFVLAAALLCRLQWARFMAWGLLARSAYDSLYALFSYPFYPMSLVFLVFAAGLFFILRGPAMNAVYEGRAKLGIDWSTRRMKAVAIALALNIGALIEMAHDAYVGSNFQGCFAGPYIHTESLAFRCAIAAGIVMLFGLWLLARQKTAGLLLTGAASIVLPFLAVQMLDRPSFSPTWQYYAEVGGLGIVSAWVALGFWMQPMVRFLLGRAPG